MPKVFAYFIDWFPQRPVELTADKRYCIGRGGGNEFYLPDIHASREHAEIKWNGEAFVLTDLGSSNGTYLNDDLLGEPTALKDGDEIRIGTHVLRLRVQEASKAESQYEETKKQVSEWQTVIAGEGERSGSEGGRAGGGLSGSIGDVSLPQVIQMLEAEKKTGRLLVTAVGISASVYFRDGRIVAADHRRNEQGNEEPAGVIEGAEAVYALLALQEGLFEFLVEDVEVEPTIQDSPQALLMEGVRRLDEQTRGDPDTEDTQKL